ncbi:MAG: lysophospholipid acyltransferase family protein [Burkholderiaceae bacterium]
MLDADKVEARAAAVQSWRAAWAVLHVAWALWAWSVFGVAGAAHAWARCAIAMSGIRVRVEGLARLPSVSAAVLVANHASYADSILLVAALPPQFGFAAKRELATTALVGTLLRRLGTVFVERVGAAGGVEDTGVLEAHARAGERLLVFPEGTFRRAPGLLPFKLSAFVVAARTGAPIVPVSLVGMRSPLRNAARRAILACVAEPDSDMRPHTAGAFAG